MKIYVACRRRLVDTLCDYFCPTTEGRINLRARLLARLRNACRAGVCTSAFAVSDFGFWDFLDFGIRAQSRTCFDSSLRDDVWSNDEIAGHRNLLRPPRELFEFAHEPPVHLPLRRPIWTIPHDYILFSDGADADDLTVDDHRIMSWLRTYLPVVRIGHPDPTCGSPMGGRGTTAADIDLVGCTDLTDVFWLAKHARLIVSPFSYLRTMSSLVATPVVELAQADHIGRDTLAKASSEYADGAHGMQPGVLNFWYAWDNGRAEAEAATLLSQLTS